MSKGGLMPSRSDIELPDGPLGWTADKITEEIGANNVIYTTFKPRLMIPRDEMMAKVKARLRGDELTMDEETANGARTA